MLHTLRVRFARAGTPRCCRRPSFWLCVLAGTAFLVMSGGWEAAASPPKEAPEPSLEFTPPSVAGTEGASGAYTVHLSGEPTAPVTVTLTQPTNTDVTVDTDPSTSGNQNTLSFSPANWNTPQRVTVSVDEDDDAVNEEATIGHTASGTEAYEGVSGEVQVRVKDNDAPGLVFSPISATVPEGSSYTYSVKLTAQPTAPVTVTLTPPANTDVTVDTDPSASGYQNTLTFTPSNWSTPQPVTVSVAEDDDAVNEEATIGHAASATQTYESVSGDARVSIMDNDAVGLTFSPTSVTVAVRGTATYTVVLAAQPTAPVKVTLTQPTNTDVTVDTDPSAPRNQRVVTFTTDNWYAPQTVTVAAHADSDADQDTATIAHAASGAPEYEGFDENLSVTVNDDTTFVQELERYIPMLLVLLVLGVLVCLSLVWAANSRWFAFVACVAIVFLMFLELVFDVFGPGKAAVLIAGLAAVSVIILNAFRSGRGRTGGEVAPPSERINTRSARGGEDSEEQSRRGKSE